jgi:20S proteasome alpha/beta subunit
MGADDAITSELVHTNGAKITKFPRGLIVGFAGSLATMTFLINEKSPLSELVNLESDVEVHAVFKNLHALGNAQVRGVSDKVFWTELLIAMGSALVYVGNVAGWYRVKDDFRCIGEGSLLATGAMHVLACMPPRERIERSIEAASKYVPGVSKMSAYETTATVSVPSTPPSP